MSIIKWHGRQRKAFLFHPDISPKVVTYLLFPKVLILYVFSCNSCRFLVFFQFDTCVLADDVMKRMVFMILTNDFASNIGCYMCLSRLSSVFVKVVPFICWYGRWWIEENGLYNPDKWPCLQYWALLSSKYLSSNKEIGQPKKRRGI